MRGLQSVFSNLIYIVVIIFCLSGLVLVMRTREDITVEKQSSAALRTELNELKHVINRIQESKHLVSGALGTVSGDPQPSVRIFGKEEEAAQKKRKFYGGQGDKMHLGGFKGFDRMGVANNTWNYMMGPLGIKSMMDIGCGRGISTDYFLQRGAEVLCVEGSHDAVERSVLPRSAIVEHDFTRGPWWPDRTYDAAWSVEFLEHVGRHYMTNYMATLRRAAILFVTASNNGGWHHVEVKENMWWKSRFLAANFIYNDELTQRIRNSAAAGCITTDGLRVVKRMMVFINPAVASLPQHAHLFAGDGCIYEDPTVNVLCNEKFKWFDSATDTPPKAYQALLSCSYTQGHVNTADGLPYRMSRVEKETPGFGIYDCKRNPLAS
jgi:SAM-dependent methyltransferase